MSDVEIDVNDVINSLLEQVAGLSRENALLKAQVNGLQKQLDTKKQLDVKEVNDGSDTV